MVSFRFMHILNIINGDGAGNCLRKSGISGDVLVCRDLLYDGPRAPGWPEESNLRERAIFLAALTGGGMTEETILEALQDHYRQLSAADRYENVVLWFDGCLCDQAMLVHTLVCLQHLGLAQAELICIGSFDGIVPFNGLGQLKPHQLASLYEKSRPVTAAQFEYAAVVDRAFADRDLVLLGELSQDADAPLAFMPGAVNRWLQEQPDPETGVGRLESLVLRALFEGCHTPGEIFSRVAAGDESPQFWGDTILWQKINGLADRKPPLVIIEGPAARLPQWHSELKLRDFSIRIAPVKR